jgi:hypothetical protein
VVVEVALPRGGRLARLRQPVERVVPHGLQQPVARRLARAAREHRDQGPVDKAGEHVDDVPAGVGTGERDDRVERRGACLHRDPAQHRAFGLVEEAPAPVDRGAQRPVAGRGAAGTGAEQAEPVGVTVEPVGELVHPEQPYPGGRQLEGER